MATLELGQAPASQIARKLQEDRGTVYSTLHNMVKKNRMLITTKNKVFQYAAISPKTLLKTAQEKTDLFHEKMPEFLALSTLFNNKSSVQFYEGLEGLKLVYEDTLNYPDTTLKAFLGYEQADRGLQKYLNNVYLPQRIKRNITAKVLLSGEAKENHNYIPTNRTDNSAKYTQLKFISNPLFELSNEINLYGGDKVALIMFSEHEMKGLLIKSKQLFITLNSLFDLARNSESDDK